MNPLLRIVVSITKQTLQAISFSFFAVSVATFMPLHAVAQSPDSASQERQLRVKEFKDMPILVRKTRNLDKDTWYKDLEIEIKNVSGKPIYGIHANLSLPDAVIGNGRYGIPLVFGKSGNADIRNLADPADDHLDPGEIYVLTIPADLQRGLERHHQTMPWTVKRLELSFSLISFGDRTGFDSTRFVDYRNSPAPKTRMQ